MIGILSTSRSDWGLLLPVKKALEAMNVETRVYGPVRAEGDVPSDIARTMGLNMIEHASFQPRPRLVLCLGDRHELFSIVTCAFLNGIPIAHMHGGEKTAGSYDDIWRTGISTMATIHFPATELSLKRLMDIGIKDNLHMVGAIGADGLKKRKRQTNNSEALLMLYPQTRGEYINPAFMALS